MRYRRALPQLHGTPLLTDGGMETTLLFHQGIDLPEFATFPLLATDGGRETLRAYYRSYTSIAARHNVGFMLEAVTWRANSDWGARLGYSAAQLAEANADAIRLLEEIRDEMQPYPQPVVISGCIGPRGDGYKPKLRMSAADAESYHSEQIGTLAQTNADMLNAMTMNYVEEAIGIAKAARRAGIPVVISFTVETDGCLPTGQPLGAAITETDNATGSAPAYYMINCAHPEHFDHALDAGAPWIDRIRGLRANSSRRSHDELNNSVDLDTGNPAELGAGYARLLESSLPRLAVLGGCCGTDHRHVEQIAEACVPVLLARSQPERRQ